MIVKRRGRTGKLRYSVRIHRGHNSFEWVGTYDTLAEARRVDAQQKLKVEAGKMTVYEYAEQWLAVYERNNKASSYDTARASLKRFLTHFGHRRLTSITRMQAKQWAFKEDRSSQLRVVVTLFNSAVEDELLERNPFRGLTKRSRGRAEMAPPTAEELAKLLDACSVHGHYAPTIRALITFAAYTGMRPGELFALEWGDIDFDVMRIRVERRLYRGRIDKPKSGKGRTIVLTPPARDAILGLDQSTRTVFTAKRGARLSQPQLSTYWGEVCARAQLDFDFYLATRHYCAHHLWVTLRLPERVVVQQIGHADVQLLKEVYGHGEIGALEEIDAAFSRTVVPLRSVSDAQGAENDG